MKRDCGEGDLIPVEWEVLSVIGQSDDEDIQVFQHYDEAMIAYNKLVSKINETPCSNVRLYAKDKQGYANCILTLTHCFNGEKITTDRTKELSLNT